MEEMNQKRPAAPKRTRQNGEGGRRPRNTAGNAPAAETKTEKPRRPAGGRGPAKAPRGLFPWPRTAFPGMKW